MVIELKVPHEILACPSCFSRVNIQSTKICCLGCNKEYEISNNAVPIMLVRKDKLFFERVLREPDGTKMLTSYRRKNKIIALLKKIFSPPNIVMNNPYLNDFHYLYDYKGEETMVLNVGGGPGREDPRIINLNINDFENVDVVGNGERIPFLDGTFDSVTCNAVLEHVENPIKVVKEIYRVLKPNGYVRVEIPFLQPYHGYPTDFQRYTIQGVEKLFSKFEKIETGIWAGPSSTLTVILAQYIRLLLPFHQSDMVKFIAYGILRWILFPTKYLDFYLNKKALATDLTSCIYFIGRKRSKTLKQL